MKTRTEMMQMLRRLRRQVADLEVALGESPVSSVRRNAGAAQARLRTVRAESDTWRLSEGPLSLLGEADGTDWGLLEGLLATLPGLLCGIDTQGFVQSCQGAGVPSLGLVPEEIVGRSWEGCVGRIPEAADMVRRTLAGENPSGGLSYDATTGFALWCAPLFDDTWEIVGAVGLCIDVTELRQRGMQGWAEQGSAEDVLRTHERERRLIAYEIHDGFVQEATGAMMHLEALLQTGRVPEGRVHQEVQLALRLVRKAVGEARRLIGGLLPPVLDERGVVAALEYWIDDQTPGGPSISLHVEVPSERWDPLLEGTVYRIVQEALTNVRRHSSSDRAEVRLTQRGGILRVEVRDWGIGFDPNGIEGKRFGLRGICERARLLGGRAEIDSAPGKGTRVIVDLPRLAPHGKSQLHDRSSEWTRSEY